MATINLKVYSKLQRLWFKNRSLPLDQLKNSQFWHILDSVACVYGSFYSVDILKLGLDKQYRSLVSRRKRYKMRLRNMLKKFSQLYLVSLTFRDDVLFSTSFDSRRKYVQRWCKVHTLDYMGCVDFGKKNGREHYHIIVAVDTSMTYFKAHGRLFCSFVGLSHWEYGFSSCRPIKMAYSDMYSSLSYAFKSALYSFKSADSVYKPFFARGIDYGTQHWYLHSPNLLPVGYSSLASSESVPYMPAVYMADATAWSQHERPL